MRHDMSKWMMHFTRNKLEDQGDGELRNGASAYEVLRLIIRLNGIKPGYSLRHKKTTLYGGEPVVCATEMPIYSLAKYVQSRRDEAMVSGYGIAFLKEEFFKMEARPAIYGLSNNNFTLDINKQYIRTLPSEILPLNEQYRYVPLNMSQDRWIDWSHEREWRWKPKDDSEEICYKDSSGVYSSFKGIPIFSDSINTFSKIAIMVWSRKEAEEIQADLTGFYLAASNNYDTPFSKKVLEKSNIIILEDVIEAVEKDGEINSQTIEGLEASKLIQPIILREKTEKNRKEITDAIAKAEKKGNEVVEISHQKNLEDIGPCGRADVISYEVTNPIIQEMLKIGIANGPYDGKVKIKLNVCGYQLSMDHHLEYTRPMCDILNEELEEIFELEERLD